MKAMDRSKYEVMEYFISKEGKWKPEPILPEPGVHPGIDVVFPVLFRGASILSGFTLRR